ncbi:MAG: hypothetical protein A2W99_05145 [Bacteroidetes bacterium GWF2_33_16]|nr:MAG: hypothetical protein A2X00_17665 [Bacteroidetes bacterium GWE2_32_14]OFY06052.1 MAG: hypothetical protein A2W99_05145 [Bacteroidetes bacterium GWF2_33_16]
MRKLFFLLVLPFLIIQSCDEEKSDKNDIIDFSIAAISNQNFIQENIVIDKVYKKIFVAFSNTDIETIFPITITPTIKISSGAKINPKSGEAITFNHPDDYISYEVTSEDGKKEIWNLQLIHKQIQNSNFQKWYTVQITSSVGYHEVGSSYNSALWASANAGTSTYAIFNTLPYVIDEDSMALIKTDAAGPVPVAAGTLFTGKFNIKGAISNPTNPKAATDFGIPFYWKPTSMKFKFKYTAGDDYIRATLLNPTNLFGGFTIEHLEGEDQCNIYAILEQRSGDQVLEIGRANFVSSTTGIDFTEQIVDFIYTSTLNPTHITVVFTSSKDGDYWTGAVGSTLIINDLELIYSE